MEENMQGESSMDEKAFLLQEIRYSKRKQNVKKFLRYESTGIAAGGTIAMVLEGCAVFVPFYTVHVWAVLAVLCGAAAGGIYTVMKRCTMVQAAQQIDRFGFQERIVTAYGRIGKEGSIDRMQRSDAVHMLQEDHAWKKARVCPDRRKLVALFLSLGLALVLSFVPSPAHKQAQQRHAIRQEAREKEKGNPKSDGCLKTDRHLFHDKRTKESPAGTDTVTGLIAKRNAAGRYEAGTGICRAETFLQVWTGGTDFRDGCPCIGT